MQDIINFSSILMVYLSVLICTTSLVLFSVLLVVKLITNSISYYRDVKANIQFTQLFVKWYLHYQNTEDVKEIPEYLQEDFKKMQRAVKSANTV